MSELQCMDDILDIALRGGLITDPSNFEYIAGVCNCDVDFVRGFALGVTYKTDIENTPEEQTMESLKQQKGLLEEQLSQVEKAMRSKRRLEADTPKKKRQKIEVKWEPQHEYLPREIEPLPPPKPPSPKKSKSETKSRRKSHLVRVRLYCAHCERFFYAKPTKRVNLHVLNHQCNGDKRKQFVVGRHHRRCSYEHPADVPCIDFAPKGWDSSKFANGYETKKMKVKEEQKEETEKM